MNYYCDFDACRKQGVVFFLLLVLLMQPVGAQSYADARDFLSVLIDDVVSEIKINDAVYREDTEKLYDLIDERIVSSVDMELFGKLTLGGHWNSASETQRLMFTNALRRTMVRSYGKSLLLLSNVEKIDYPLPDTTKQTRYQIVRTMLFFVGGQAPVSINYAMLFKEDRWVVFDLIVDGLSVGKQFRQNFDIEIKDKGLDALITRLAGDAASL
ncbi:MAG: ABC transporter substrate-binding protein [Chromatiales bacterium]|nr:ABC transporter substrate-binding protein [Chromatiales bacterium]